LEAENNQTPVAASYSHQLYCELITCRSSLLSVLNALLFRGIISDMTEEKNSSSVKHQRATAREILRLYCLRQRGKQNLFIELLVSSLNWFI